MDRAAPSSLAVGCTQESAPAAWVSTRWVSGVIRIRTSAAGGVDDIGQMGRLQTRSNERYVSGREQSRNRSSSREVMCRARWYDVDAHWMNICMQHMGVADSHRASSQTESNAGPPRLPVAERRGLTGIAARALCNYFQERRRGRTSTRGPWTATGCAEGGSLYIGANILFRRSAPVVMAARPGPG